MTSTKLENYLTLLTIRRAGRRRDALISGGIFFISMIAITALSMLDQLSERSIYFSAAMVTCFGISFLMTWVRFEIIKGSIELVENLLRMEKE